MRLLRGLGWVTTILLGTGYTVLWLIHWQVAAQIGEIGTLELAPRVEHAHRYVIESDGTSELVRQSMNESLQSLRVYSHLLELGRCALWVPRLTESNKNTAVHSVSIPWSAGEKIHEFTLNYNYTFDTPHYWMIQAGIVLVFLFLWEQLPKPVPDAQRKWLAELEAAGVPQKQAQLFVSQAPLFNQRQAEVVRGLLVAGYDLEKISQWIDEFGTDIHRKDSFELNWLLHSLQLTNNFAQSMQVAASPAVMQLSATSQEVTVHGLPIPLAKTPFFYLYWYAKRRALASPGEDADSSWMVNPSSHRPELKVAEELVTLMEEFGGHRKAINDLKENGLRAKILDQNRNKIKEEFRRTLGEALSADFLFEVQRDSASGRSRYRLRCPATQIVLS